MHTTKKRNTRLTDMDIQNFASHSAFFFRLHRVALKITRMIRTNYLTLNSSLELSRLGHVESVSSVCLLFFDDVAVALECGYHYFPQLYFNSPKCIDGS